MAKINRKTYTDAEKAFYIAEFQRLHKGGSRTYESIARELGVHVSSYYSCVAAGIKPISAPVQAASAVKPNTIYPPAERKRLFSEVERHRANSQSVVSACQLAGIGPSEAVMGRRPEARSPAAGGKQRRADRRRADNPGTSPPPGKCQAGNGEVLSGLQLVDLRPGLSDQNARSTTTSAST